MATFFLFWEWRLPETGLSAQHNYRTKKGGIALETQDFTKNENAATIGEIVVKDYRTAAIFKKYGIDFCYGGKKTLADVCRQKGINMTEVNEALQTLDKQQQQSTQDYTVWELDCLADHIVNTHHKYVNESLPLLYEFSAKVASVHGEANPEVVEISFHYHAVANELRMHMHKEEAILFPYIGQIAMAKRNNEPLPLPPFGTVKNPINMMEAEHDSAGNAMEAIKELSNSYNPPEHA